MSLNSSYNQVCSILNNIGKKYKNNYIEFPFTLYEDVDFNKIINNPAQFKTLLLTVLKDSKIKNLDKLIALYGLQHLCIDDYLCVLKVVFIEYEESKVDEIFLLNAISQDGFSLEVSKNYSNKKLKTILQTISKTLKVEANRSYIEDVLSGKNWKDLVRYYKESNENKPWICE